MDERPKLDNCIALNDFKEFYWLKKELVDFCRQEGLKATGSKLEITEQIQSYLATGIKKLIPAPPKPTTVAGFDWKNAPLSTETRITDKYKNTENVRLFFEEQIGKHFKFNVKFMNWMKDNNGKTLHGAIKEWKRIAAENKARTQPKEIAPQFEYNTFMRDFSADNPKLERSLGIKLWKIKSAMRGDNTYNRADLTLLKIERFSNTSSK